MFIFIEKRGLNLKTLKKTIFLTILIWFHLTLFSLSALFNGFFIEAGAFNGEDISNSLFFGKEINLHIFQIYFLPFYFDERIGTQLDRTTG